MKFKLKTGNFAILFAKKPDKTNTTKLVVTYFQTRIEPYIFTKFFQKTYKPTYKPTMYTNLVTYTRAIIVLFMLI